METELELNMLSLWPERLATMLRLLSQSIPFRLFKFKLDPLITIQMQIVQIANNDEKSIQKFDERG